MVRHKNQITVLKFGSSVLRSEKDLPTAVHEIYRHWREGDQVIAVVSAFGDTTDELMRRAESVCGDPDKAALAALLATGEAASSALLGLALNRAGIPARVLDASQAGLRTAGGKLDANPVGLDSARLLGEARRGVVVLPGFVGRCEGGDTTLLGRGGSDLTALFLAHRLSARCMLVKDVDGLYSSDPACVTVRPSRFAKASYETASRLGGAIVQPKAVRFAQAHRQPFSITAIGSGSSTEVGPFTDLIDNTPASTDPLRVALLGCGTVGGGVYQRLDALPELFSIIGVGTRTGERAYALGVPKALITSDLESLVEERCDVVVELIGDAPRATSLIKSSLRLGRDVLTANKAVIAANGEALEILAEENGASLKYNAAVGGVLPALETINQARAVGPLREFSGVLNSTCNFILDRLAEGATMSAAVRAAQNEGYAEADPRIDLSGIDAAQKLILLSRAAFGVNLPLESVERKGIDGLEPETIKQAERCGQIVRLVARCRWTARGLEASVEPVRLPFDHPLARTRGAENRLLIQPQVGEGIVVSGKGAGRWPTTEVVMADLLEIVRNRVAGEERNQRFSRASASERLGLYPIEQREECVA